MERRGVVRWSALVAVAACVALAPGCGGSGGGAEAVRVAVVADSEIPTDVADLVGAHDGVDVVVASSADGAKMAELDPTVAEALADDPDVLVWSGGTNDLGDGPMEMLAGVTERLADYAERACVVFAVPVFRYEPGKAAEVEAQTAGTRVLEEEAVDAGAVVVSYLDVSLAMAEEGREFFAPGELGDIHPGPQAYPDIAAAIVEAVGRCGP